MGGRLWEEAGGNAAICTCEKHGGIGSSGKERVWRQSFISLVGSGVRSWCRRGDRIGGRGFRRRICIRARRRRHCRFRIQQMVVARSKAQFDQRPRIWHRLGLPSLIGLIAPQGSLGRVVPFAGRLALHEMLANQSFLNLLRALGFDRFLAARFRSLALGFRPGALLVSRWF